MNNKSNFLNLPFGLPGDARRHVPFRSIIHIPLCLIFVLVFVFSIMFSYRTSAYALAAPQLNPVYNTDIVQIEEYVNGLSSGQMDVFNILLGFYLASQAGTAKYQLVDPYETQEGVLNWLKSCGIKFYNDFGGWIPTVPEITGFDEGKILSIILGAAVLADQYESQSDFVSDLMSSENYFLPFNQGLQIGINQFLASNNGLYNWSLVNSDWVSTLNFNSINVDDSTLQLNYFNALYPPDMFVRRSYPSDSIYYNYRVSSDNFITYHNVFINTSFHTVSIVDDNGNLMPGRFYSKYAYFVIQNNNLRLINDYGEFQYGNSFNVSYPSSLNPLQVAQSLFNGSSDSVLGNNNYYNDFFISDFVDNVYYGNNWQSRNVLTNTEDLNFSNNDDVSYDQVQTDLLLDIKGLLQDLIDTNELREPVFDNLYDTSGQPVPDPATVNVSVNAIFPESGIDIPVNLFSPLTKEGGYISYLWFMTKPLVQYTSDFVQTMVFDGNEDFDITGPGAIVFGVISLGLIGGLVVKCLL